MDYLQLISATIIAVGLFYLHLRRVDTVRQLGETQGYARGYSAGLAESNQRLYSKGHADGLTEGRLKEQLDHDTRAAKALKRYEDGYQDALEDMHALNDSAMLATTGDTIRLSA